MTASAGECCVLGVGIATLDIVNRVACYPPEDAEVRALGQRASRGGNAANTLAVLRQLGRCCRWAGTLAEDAGAALIRDDLDRRGIGRSGSVSLTGSATPTSYITLSEATGSRTIVHHRDLAELGAGDFARVSLDGCAWVHFEGRNPEATAEMIARVHRVRPELPVSIEIEKPRFGIEALFRKPVATGARGLRVLIFARAYAEAGGGGMDARAFLHEQAQRCDADLLVAPWGADGAYGLRREADVVHVAAHRPARVIDTLAAGDVFNAGIIDALLASDTVALDDRRVAQVLGHANRLAGHGCGIDGLDALVDSARAAGLL